MSVLVKGMKMPDSCAVCRFAGKGGYHMERVVCMFTGKNEDAVKTDRLPECPLVALPDKHGRLGDLDALRKSVLKWLPHDPCGVEEYEHPYETDICVSMLMEIEDAPTIVEAEDES